MLALQLHTTGTYDIGVDEAGRGPLLGRVYAAAVVLPPTFDVTRVKDSKKYTSAKKREQAAQYVQEHALAWHVSYVDERVIDSINILAATKECMREAIQSVWNQMQQTWGLSCALHVLVDGNSPPIMITLPPNTMSCVVKGDNTYACIAAASVLAKVFHDRYIDELCVCDPQLEERYKLTHNKGYGTKEHLDGIRTYGITPYHRTTFVTKYV